MIRRLWESLLTFWDDHFAMISATDLVKAGVFTFVTALLIGRTMGWNLRSISLFWGGFFLFWLIRLKHDRR